MCTSAFSCFTLFSRRNWKSVLSSPSRSASMSFSGGVNRPISHASRAHNVSPTELDPEKMLHLRDETIRALWTEEKNAIFQGFTIGGSACGPSAATLDPCAGPAFSVWAQGSKSTGRGCRPLEAPPAGREPPERQEYSE